MVNVNIFSKIVSNKCFIERPFGDIFMTIPFKITRKVCVGSGSAGMAVS